MILAICFLAGFNLCSLAALIYSVVHLYKENEKLYETILRIENPMAVGALKSSKAGPVEDKPPRVKPIYR